MLPRLGALSRAEPSPLLQWQLVEILYAYCTAMHLYQGDWASDAVVGPCYAVLLFMKPSGLTGHPVQIPACR